MIGRAELMKFLYKLERKFGKYAIRNLMNYIILLYGIGLVVNMVNPLIYYRFLSLDASMILRGEVWRLITFIIQPPSNNLIFVVFALYLYYIIGVNLERTWGAFKFNLYFFVGILGHILAALGIYIVSLLLTGTGRIIIMDTTYLNFSLFFAYALTYPEVKVYIYFLIPVKMKYMAYLNAAFFGLSIVLAIIDHDWSTVVAIILALLNVLLFFFLTRNYRKINPQEIYRRHQFKQQVKASTAVTKHKCAICGRTEKDGDDLVFRFCSKCNGNYEYCQEHLFTHEHVK